jgi:hypothetical protein
MGAPSWAPRIRTAHFSVGNEARGGTPYKSDANSKRSAEMCSKAESRTEIAAMKADIGHWIPQKEISSRQKSSQLIIVAGEMINARKSNCHICPPVGFAQSRFPNPKQPVRAHCPPPSRSLRSLINVVHDHAVWLEINTHITNYTTRTPIKLRVRCSRATRQHPTP